SRVRVRIAISGGVPLSGPDLEPPFDVFVDAGIHKPAKFFIVERGPALFDEPAQLVEEKVVAFDPIIKVLQRVFHRDSSSIYTARNRTSPFAGSIVSIRTSTISPGWIFTEADTLPPKSES